MITFSHCYFLACVRKLALSCIFTLALVRVITSLCLRARSSNSMVVFRMDRHPVLMVPGCDGGAPCARAFGIIVIVLEGFC